MSAVNKQKIRHILGLHEFSEEAIRGILANIDVETGGTYDYTTVQRGGDGYGLFQFDFMKPHYFSWIETNGLPDSAEAQIKFMRDAIYDGITVKNPKGEDVDLLGGGKREELLKGLSSKDPVETTTSFMEIFEDPGTPHLDRRIKSALEDTPASPKVTLNSPTETTVPAQVTLSSPQEAIPVDAGFPSKPVLGTSYIDSILSGNKDAKGPVEDPGYTIQGGDTLSQIAQRNGTTTEALANLNGIENPDMIMAGAQLRIPPKQTEAPTALATIMKLIDKQMETKDA